MENITSFEYDVQIHFSFQKIKFTVDLYQIDTSMEIEEQRYGKNKHTIINHTYVNSGEYRRKFDQISSSKVLNKLIYSLAKCMLKHRSGTDSEDMYWIDPINCTIVAKEIDGNYKSEIIYSEQTRKSIRRKNGLITIHSHPNSFPPSIQDFNSNFTNGYSLGIVVCHDGKVFLYYSGCEINERYYNLVVEEYLKIGFNEYEAQIYAIKDLVRTFNIMCKEVTINGS